MELRNKKVLVIGTGLSGIAAAKLLIEKGSEVILYDSNKKLSKELIIDKLPENGEVEFIIGEWREELECKAELVILSPGVPTDLPYIVNMRRNNIPIWGEVELAYNYSKGKLVAITGTNGKTTTTALVGEIMKTFYESVFVVGNIGIPYTGVVSELKDDSVTVAEVSSFQLETIDNFKPDVSAILNITPDHLNRHHTMENYIKIKFDIAANQEDKEICVLNYEDEVLRSKAEMIKAKVVFFSSRRKLDNGVFLRNKKIFYGIAGQESFICSIDELQLLGTHNYENIMAGIAIGVGMGIPIECIKKAITSFKAVEHRIEYVTTKKGVKYYNDSKGTNTDAAIKGINAMVAPTLLIAGGYDKGSEYDEWIKAFDNKVKYLVLLGDTKEKIAKTAKKYGFKNIIMVESLKEAVDTCAAKATVGDSVLLSPACASWGMFKNYEERGKMFKEYVNSIL